MLPFTNDTGDSQLQWLALGYSDMFSESLRKMVPAQVVPTYLVQGIMTQNNQGIDRGDGPRPTRLPGFQPLLP